MRNKIETNIHVKNLVTDIETSETRIETCTNTIGKRTIQEDLGVDKEIHKDTKNLLDMTERRDVTQEVLKENTGMATKKKKEGIEAEALTLQIVSLSVLMIEKRKETETNWIVTKIEEMKSVMVEETTSMIDMTNITKDKKIKKTIIS